METFIGVRCLRPLSSDSWFNFKKDCMLHAGTQSLIKESMVTGAIYTGFHRFSEIGQIFHNKIFLINN